LELLIKPIAAICKSLADENRLRILLAIGNDKRSVSQIVETTGLSQPLVSHHLKELRRCHLLTVERQKPFVYCVVGKAGFVRALSEFCRGQA
jgi:DNA-binding transcriptional ArsR family regulator